MERKERIATLEPRCGIVASWTSRIPLHEMGRMVGSGGCDLRWHGVLLHGWTAVTKQHSTECQHWGDIAAAFDAVCSGLEALCGKEGWHLVFARLIALPPLVSLLFALATPRLTRIFSLLLLSRCSASVGRSTRLKVCPR